MMTSWTAGDCLLSSSATRQLVCHTCWGKLASVALMLGHRRRRWTNTNAALAQRPVFAECVIHTKSEQMAEITAHHLLI